MIVPASSGLSTLLGVALIMLTGCATVPMATASETRELFATIKQPPPGRAFVAVNRPQKMGGDVLVHVKVNGHVVGELARHTYLVLDVPAGTYEIGASCPGCGRGTEFIPATIEANWNGKGVILFWGPRGKEAREVPVPGMIHTSCRLVKDGLIRLNFPPQPAR
jgi:hypothetical protein